MSALVSLYSLERQLDAHRDTLERLCRLEQIPVIRRRNVRSIDVDRIARLSERLAIWKLRDRPWAVPSEPDRSRRRR